VKSNSINNGSSLVVSIGLVGIGVGVTGVLFKLSFSFFIFSSTGDGVGVTIGKTGVDGFCGGDV